MPGLTNPSSLHNNRLLTVLFIGVLMAALDIAVVGPALPAIRADFGVSDRTLSWIFTLYVLFNLIGTPLMAKLSDIFGRRAIYAADVGLFAAGSLVVILAPAFGVLLAGRAIQGLGAGGIFPVASAVIGDAFPPHKRGAALGLIGAVFGLAFIIGPVLGGLLLLVGWRWIFVINLPTAAVVLLLSLRWLPGGQMGARAPFDIAGMLTLGLLLAGLAFGINKIDTAHLVPSLASWRVWPFLALAVVLVPVFWQLELQGQDPVIHPGLFGTRQLRLAEFLALGAGMGEAALVFLPALAVAAFSVSDSSASFMLMPVVLSMSFGSPLAGRLLDRFGSKAVILGGTGLLAAGMLALGSGPGSLGLFYANEVLLGLGLSALLGAPVRYIMINEAPEQERAAAQGVITIFGSVGQLMSAAMVGAVAASAGGGQAGYLNAYLAIGLISLVLVLATLGLKGRSAEMPGLRQPMAAVDSHHQL
jgi:MFS family permease